MSYIPPLVFSSLSLLDPFITAFLAWITGLEGLPSIFSWIGGLIVISGVALISYGEKSRHPQSKVNSETKCSSTNLANVDEQS